MHIVIVSPSDSSYISSFLPNVDKKELPTGSTGAVFIGTLITELLELGHVVTAVTTSSAINNDYSVKKYSYNNFSWIVVPSRPKGFGMNGYKVGRILDFYKREIKEMVKAIKSISPDIVHAHWSYEFAFAAQKSDFPFLVTVHDDPIQVLRFSKHPYRIFKLIMAEYILRKTKYTSTVSPYMLSYLNKRSNNIQIIPNPTPLLLNKEEVEVLIKKRVKSKKAPNIIMINNGWNTLKNGKIGLEAFHKLLINYPKAQLHLYGKGSGENELAAKEAALLGVENVNFHGVVSNTEIFEALKSAHLFIHPSFEESFGVVLVEAMSIGVPAIGGKDSGAVPWVIGNESLLVDVKKIKELACKMKELLEDDAVYQSTSLNCFQNVSTRFSSESVGKQYCNYYEKIIENSIS